MEKWKSIPGIVGLEASNFGNIRNLNYWNKKGNVKVLKQSEVGGYKTIGYKGKTFSVHRLVALSWVKNKRNEPCVNHKDENKTNNHFENLEWVSYEENTNYGTRNLRASKSLKGRTLSKEHIRSLVMSHKGIPNNQLGLKRGEKAIENIRFGAIKRWEREKKGCG